MILVDVLLERTNPLGLRRSIEKHRIPNSTWDSAPCAPSCGVYAREFLRPSPSCRSNSGRRGVRESCRYARSKRKPVVGQADEFC